MDPTTQDITYNIPEDIRPKMTSYRLEVIFWGVRNMKKINYIPVLSPQIVIECAGVRVKSEVMQNARRFSNFKEINIAIDLVNISTGSYYNYFGILHLSNTRVYMQIVLRSNLPKGNARARYLLSMRDGRGVRLTRIRLLQVRRDMHDTERLRLHGAIND